jgi:hypothetical protein
MRNTLFAAAAAFALILGTAPTFAAESNPSQPQAQPAANPGGQQQQVQPVQPAQPQANHTDNGKGDCAALTANKSGHSDAEIAACQKQ